MIKIVRDGQLLKFVVFDREHVRCFESWLVTAPPRDRWTVIQPKNSKAILALESITSFVGKDFMFHIHGIDHNSVASNLLRHLDEIVNNGD